MDKEQILEYYRKERGYIPDFVDILARERIDFLEKYYEIRRIIIDEGALPRKVKELILLGVSAANGSSHGVKTHAKDAVKAGASREEILDTALLVFLASGIPALISVLDCLKALDI